MAHTPGPEFTAFTARSLGRTVEEILAERATAEARARITAAAPYLLAALKMAAPIFCSMCCPSVFTGPDQASHCMDCQEIKAAIAKAEATHA